MKRILSVVLAFLTAFACLSSLSLAAEELTITDYNYPTEITEGKTFSVYGTVKSGTLIKEVTCSVTKSNGELQFTKTVYPEAYSYSVANLDEYMTFSRLKAGDYIYKITASDASAKGKVLLNKSFKVKTNQPSLKITGANYPTVIESGSPFSVYGVVESEYLINTVVIGVYNPDGTAAFSYTGKPGTTSYDIHNVDYLLTFSKLTAGSYIYRITASDYNTKNVVLLEKNFTVTKKDIPEDGLQPVDWNVIDLSYWNEITSWDKIAQNVDGVILRIGYRSTGAGLIGEDSNFKAMYDSAAARGIPVGCYFFSAAKNPAEATEEAEFVISKLKQYGCKLSFPVYFDMETDYQVNMNRADCTELAKAFCGRMTQAGYYTGIYCNKYFARDEIYANSLSEYTFWIAQYGSACTYDGPYGMWQYSETGSVPGIYGNVDLNECYYDFPSYIKANGLNGFDAEKPVSTFNLKGGAEFDSTGKFITKIEHSLTTKEFTSRYISSSSDVTVSFTNTVGGRVATGTVISVKGGKDFGSFTVCVRGDADSNALLNSSDALAVLEHSTGRRTLGSAAVISADYNSDKKVNSTDALLILQASVGM